MEYFILKPDGEQTGTFSIDQIRAMLNTGFIGLDTRYWHEGASDWQPIDRIEESLNFPELGPDAPHRTPPPARKWTGSLARAIPSPHQMTRKTSAIPLSLLPAAPGEKPAVPEAPMRGAEIPAASLRIEHPPGTDGAPVYASAPAEPVAVETIPQAQPPRRRRLSGPALYALSTLLLVLVIIAAIVLSRHPAKSPLSKLTLTSRNVYVLTDQASIKTFEDDMRNSPVADSLKRQIAQSTNPVFLQRINIALQQEIARHAGEVTESYLRSGKAEVIAPDTYNTVGYFDDNGVLTVPRAGEPWVGIQHKGNVVYAYQGSDFNLTSQSPQGLFTLKRAGSASVPEGQRLELLR